MKSGRRIALAAGLLIGGAAVIRGELEPWIQHLPAGQPLSALFRQVPMPGGAIEIRRPPAETRPALTKLIAAAPREAALYRLRAREAELAQDFAAAEADWKAYASAARDSYAAHLDLADFYHRQIRPRDEIAALTAAARTKDDPLEPKNRQHAWHAFERMAAVVESDALPESVAEPVFRAWVARYPKEPVARRRLIERLTAHRQFAAAEAEIANYGRAFHDHLEIVRMRAALALIRDSADAAIRVYDAAFQPLWPEDMSAPFFKLLEEQGRLREFAGRARTALAANHADLDATARMFHYYRAQQNQAGARRVLLEYRIAKESGKQPWTADELLIVAQLFERFPDVNEAARLYYALYSTPQAERALAGLANLLLTAPEQPIAFGSADLSFYKDIATVDRSPGFLNGILSLVLNWTGPRWEYERQNDKSAAYFHRAAAAQLLAQLEQRYPKSTYRAPLRAALVTAYGAYGDDEAVIRAGRAYLAAFPAGAARVAVALQISDALARHERTAEEFAVYDELLRELGGKALRVPIGSIAAAASNPAANPAEGRFVPLQRIPAIPAVRFVTPQGVLAGIPFATPQVTRNPGSAARSPEYVQVLDKYLSRLAGLNRGLDALRVYRTEIDRNPNDPGLYARLAAFLEQHEMGRELEAVYNQAITKFADRSWYDKLARWYLRNRESAALEKLSRQAITVFSGSELERYFSEVVSQTHPDAVLYRQLNLYAHERFPEDLIFVRNLISAYHRTGSYNPAAAERLLREYWFYDPQLRTALFEQLSREGLLYRELAEVRPTDNPAALQFITEAEGWLSHFEAAAPVARTLATAYPGRREFTSRASALYRSLAAYDPRNTDIAAGLAGREQQSDKRDTALLAKIGDIYAERERFTRARTFWDRMPDVQPGKPEAYLDAATVYWDYYRYDDALRLLAGARLKFKDREIYAYQAGAIYEGKRDYRRAVREYLSGALDGDASATQRLLRLAGRPHTRDLVEQATAGAVLSIASHEAVTLRIAVLERQQRRGDLEALLDSRVQAEKSPAALTELQEVARRLGFERIEQEANDRLVTVTNDPVDKMRLTLASARFRESKKDIASAASVIDGLYHDHPLVLGVVRGAADFHVRNGQYDSAIEILLASAKQANVELAPQFTLEAARIATTAGQFDRARGLLAGLLAADPLRAEYLTAMADTYLRAHDDRGFRDFQLATIRQLKQPDRIASIRRSVIPALARLGDHAAAVEQYILTINSYPEDEALTKEAATYAVAHNQAGTLAAFYRKTIAEAPLDYRWPIVLGRIETVMEDYAAAITDYERAMKARPDRADVVEAKARLEERLMRFPDAIKSYSRLYELAYRDPRWLIKVAELDARSGHNAEAVSALRTAIIGARTETADADLNIAERLESWHLLPEAVSFAERGANLTPTYVRIMTLGRRLETVMPRLDAKKDIPLMQEAGNIVARYYTPEEKSRAAEMLSARPDLLALAESAGLVDIAARWRLQAMTAQASWFDPQFVLLQSRRGLYAQLGRQMEKYADDNPGRPVESTARIQSIHAYIAEGDIESQMRVMGKALERNALGGVLLDRYLALLAARRPQELLAVARGHASSEIRNRAVQFAIASDKLPLAYAAVRERGAGLPPVWTKAFTALAGVYFDDRAPSINAAFTDALDTRTIGARLQAAPSRDAIIVGPVWFYYAARYGEYLAEGKSAEAEAWLPAPVEAAPGSADRYLALGRFESVLQLDPDRGDAHDGIARRFWSQGRKAEAIAEWRAAIAVFRRVQDRGVRVPEPFWRQASDMFGALGERHALGGVRREIADLIGDYYQRNYQYRLHELLEPLARASVVSGEGTAWLIEMGRSMADPEMMVNTLRSLAELSEAQRLSLQRDEIELLAKRVQTLYGDDREFTISRVKSARAQLIYMLLEAGDVKGAAEEFGRLGEGYPALEIQVASRTGALAPLLERYRTEPEKGPAVETLREAALELRKAHDDNGSRAVLEFLYDREIRGGDLAPANFLGLAEVKLQRGEAANAIALLNRVALVADDGFDTLLPAADLLRRYHQTAAAADFVRRRIKAVPWDVQARLQLGDYAPVIDDSQAEYRLRAEAARMAGRSFAADAIKPYHLEARIDAARQARDPGVQLRLWQQALAIAPGDERARLGALRAALAQHRDSLALALEDAKPEPQYETRYRRWRGPEAASVLPQIQLTDAERADLAEALAGAAERLEDLKAAQSHLQLAINLRPPNSQVALIRKRDALAAEQARREMNAARQPVIKNIIEQDQVVRPRIQGGAQ